MQADGSPLIQKRFITDGVGARFTETVLHPSVYKRFKAWC